MTDEQFADQARARLAARVAAFALGCEVEPSGLRDRGGKGLAAMRRLAIYLTYTAFGMSLARCAAAFARDRSTIAHACQQIEDQRDDAAFDEWVDGLETGLKALAPYAASSAPVQ